MRTASEVAPSDDAHVTLTRADLRAALRVRFSLAETPRRVAQVRALRCRIYAAEGVGPREALGATFARETHLVATLGRRVAASISVEGPWTRGPRQGLAYIRKAVVEPRLRIGWVARSLMTLAVETIVARGARRVRIAVYPRKPRLLAFYRRLGFRVVRGAPGEREHGKIVLEHSLVRSDALARDRIRMFRFYRRRLDGLSADALPVARLVAARASRGEDAGR